MIQKIKQKTEASQGVWAGVMRIWGSCKANPLGALVIALGSIVLVGILNSLLANFYDSCSKAMGNASVGFWRKFVDIYYISAAKAELTDAAVEIYTVMQFIFIGVLWAALSLLRSNVAELNCTLSELDEIEKNITREEKESAVNNKEQCITSNIFEKTNVSELLERIRRLREKLFVELETFKKNNFWQGFFAILFTVVIFFLVTIENLSYLKLKQYRRCVTAIRPFITAVEHQTLDRQWILMRSKSDHQKIIEKIKVYEKRADDRTKEDAVHSEHDCNKPGLAARNKN